MINLFKKQIPVFNKFKKKGYIYLVAPPGFGKSFIGMKAIEDSGRAIILCPSHLISQWSEYLSGQNFEYSVNCFDRGISIWSVQKITLMLKKIKLPKKHLVKPEIYSLLKEKEKKNKNFIDEMQTILFDSTLIIDEFHRVVGATSSIYKIMQGMLANKYMFLSATPVERGIEDFYTALRINYRYGLVARHGKEWRSVSSFKENFCKMGGFENREIKSVNKEAYDIMVKELTVVKYSNNEDKLIKIVNVVVDQKEVDGEIKKYKKSENEKYNFTVARTILNGFRYIDDGFNKETVRLFESNKPMELEKIISKQKGKALLFYEFTAELELLKKNENIGFYDKKKFNKYDFEKSDKKVMAVHYKSLGEGVRFMFIDSIHMYTVSVSNKMKTQSIGRGIFSGRETPLTCYIYTTNSKFEESIVKKLNKKQKAVDSILKDAYKINNKTLTINRTLF